MPIKRIQRGRNHSYSIDGRKAIGVTTAIGEGFPKPALPYWAAKVVAQHVVDMDLDDLDVLRRLGREAAVGALKNIPWAQRNAAAVRGTEVHNIAEKVITGQDVPIPEHLFGHVEAVVAFLDEWQVKPVLVEKVVGSYAFGYCGTFDLIGDLPDGRRVLFDYKTSAGIYPDMALQLAAYRWADVFVAEKDLELPMSEVRIDEAKAVHVRADGYDVIPLDTSESVFKIFCHCLAVAKARQSDDGKWAGTDVWKLPAELPGDYAHNNTDFIEETEQ